MVQPMSQPNQVPPALKAHEHAGKRDWPGYFKAVEGKPARDTLLKSLELFEKEWAASGTRPQTPFAIDPALRVSSLYIAVGFEPKTLGIVFWPNTESS